MPTFSSLQEAVEFIESQPQANAVNLPTFAISKTILMNHLNQIDSGATLSVSIIKEEDGTPSLLIYDKAQVPTPGNPWPPICRLTSNGQRVCCPPTCNSITVSTFATEEQS